jgi:hypothetical protein
MGTTPAFPEGDASLQKPLVAKTTIVCKDDLTGRSTILHELKNNPKFKKTSASLFTAENIKNLYIFLTHIDSTYLFIEDCDYSLLKFLRYKTKEQNLQFAVIDSTEYIVKEENLRVIRWFSGIPYYIYDENFVFETKFDTYYEFWECSYKSEYGSKYPYAIPQPASLRKNYDEEQSTDLKYILSNPIMVFSIIPLNENNYDLPFNLQPQSFRTSFETTDDSDIEGTGIDLDGDKILDGFWYMDIKNTRPVEVFVRLYINVDSKWVPIWYTYFKEY